MIIPPARRQVLGRRGTLPVIDRLPRRANTAGVPSAGRLVVPKNGNRMGKLLVGVDPQWTGTGHAAGAQTERRGGAGPVGGLLGGEDPTGRSTRMRARLEKDSEHVVVARGGVVGEHGRQVGGRDPARREVEAAA